MLFEVVSCAVFQHINNCRQMISMNFWFHLFQNWREDTWYLFLNFEQSLDSSVNTLSAVFLLRLPTGESIEFGFVAYALY